MIVSVVYLQASSRVHELHELHPNPIGKPIYNKRISQSELKRQGIFETLLASPRLPRSDIFNASPILPRSLEGTSFTYSTRVGGHWQPRIIDGIALCRILQKYRQEGAPTPFSYALFLLIFPALEPTHPYFPIQAHRPFAKSLTNC